MRCLAETGGTGAGGCRRRGSRAAPEEGSIVTIAAATELGALAMELAERKIQRDLQRECDDQRKDYAMTMMSIREVSLNVEVVGHGYPLLLMHGGPGLDHWSLRPFRQLADRFTLIFYDHRCNGRSTGAPVESMTWENLTADADALRHELGFEEWAVLGHSFGGHVALEYALRYPQSLSHLVLLDTGGDSHWSQQNAADLLAKRYNRRRWAESAGSTAHLRHESSFPSSCG
jgi:pimeloyl-ACP methyl ester carboxylesterase